MHVKRLLALLFAAVFLPILLLSAALMYLHSADLERHRDQIASGLSALLGREISLNGELDLNLSMTPSVVIGDIALANASWASTPEMLAVQRVEATVALRPLLDGDIHILRLHVTGVQARLEIDAEGQGNWILADPADPVVDQDSAATPAGIKLPWLGDISIKDVDLTYTDGRSGQLVDARLDHALINASGPAAPVAFDIAAQVNSNPVEMSGKLALPGILDIADINIPLELDATVLDFKINADGSISGDAASPAVDLSMQAAAKSMGPLRELFGDAVPDVQAVELAIQVAGDPGQPVTMNLDVAADESNIKTRLILHRNGPRPKLSGQVDISDTDVASLWAPLLTGQPDKPDEIPARAVPSTTGSALEQPIALDWLDNFDADIRLKAANVNLPQLRVNHLASHVVVDQGVVTVDETRLKTEAGTVTARLQLNSRGEQHRLELDVDTTSIALGKLQPLANNARLAGSDAKTVIRLNTWGNTPSDVLAGLSGSVQLDYSNPKRNEKLSMTLLRRTDDNTPKPKLVVTADAVLDGRAISLSGDVLTPPGLLPGNDPYRVDLALQALGISGKIKGSVADPVKPDGIDLGIEARAANLDGLRQVLGQVVPAVGKTELATQLTLERSQLRLSQLRLGFGDSRIEGRVSLNTEAPKPDIDTDLVLYNLNLDKLTPPASAAAEPEVETEATEDRIFSDEPLPFDTLSLANIKARLRAENLVFNNMLLKHAELTIDLDDGQLAVALLKHPAIKGEFDATLDIDSVHKKAPSIVFKFKAPHIELAELQVYGKSSAALEGPLAVDITLLGQGHSLAQIMASLNGSSRLLIEQGQADAKAIDLLVGGLSALFGTMFSDKASKTSINCAISDVSYIDGVMTQELGVLDTQYSTVFLEGHINLHNEQVDIKVSPEAKGVTLSVAFPVRLRGTLNSYKIEVEKTGTLIKTGELLVTLAYPPTALVNFSDLTGGRPNPCINMVAEHSGIPIIDDLGRAVGGVVTGVGGTAVKGADKVVKGVGGVVEDAGTGLGKIFKSSPEDSESTGAELSEEEEADLFLDY